MPKRIFEGTIISDKMENTVVVKVERVKQHSKYKKRYKVHKKYKAHVDNDGFSVGDKVTIEECKPISKDKTWRVISKMSETSNKVVEKLDTNGTEKVKEEKPKDIKEKKEKE